MTIHTDFRKGQKLFLIYKDGGKKMVIYLGNKSGYLLTKYNGKIPLKQLRSVTIYKDKKSTL